MRNTWFGNLKRVQGLKVSLLFIALVVFGLFLTGCIGGFTVEFKVENTARDSPQTITKIEFFDGPNDRGRDPLLAAKTVRLRYGESVVFKVSGFTNKQWGRSDDQRNFSISITFENGPTRNGGEYIATNKRKIYVGVNSSLLSLHYLDYMVKSGNW